MRTRVRLTAGNSIYIFQGNSLFFTYNVNLYLTNDALSTTGRQYHSLYAFFNHTSRTFQVAVLAQVQHLKPRHPLQHVSKPIQVPVQVLPRPINLRDMPLLVKLHPTLNIPLCLGRFPVARIIVYIRHNRRARVLLRLYYHLR